MESNQISNRIGLAKLYGRRRHVPFCERRIIICKLGFFNAALSIRACVGAKD